MEFAICWAIALVRSMQALLNINVQGNQRKELSIQHVVNKVPYVKEDGIHNMKKAFAFAKNKGTCSSSQCSPNTFDGNVAERFECRHPGNIHTETVDDFFYTTDVNDNELMAVVAQQPVIGILRNVGGDFMGLRSDQIYRSSTEPTDVSFHQVLMVDHTGSSRIGMVNHGETVALDTYIGESKRVVGQSFTEWRIRRNVAIQEEKMELDLQSRS